MVIPTEVIRYMPPSIARYIQLKAVPHRRMIAVKKPRNGSKTAIKLTAFNLIIVGPDCLLGEEVGDPESLDELGVISMSFSVKFLLV